MLNYNNAKRYIMYDVHNFMQLGLRTTLFSTLLLLYKTYKNTKYICYVNVYYIPTANILEFTT